MAAVGGERDARDVLLVPEEAGDFDAGVGVPDAHRFVPRPAGDAVAVGRERDAQDRLLVTAHAVDSGTAVGVPDAQSMVLRPAGDAAAVGGESDAQDPRTVPMPQASDFCAGLGVPDANGAVLRPGGDAAAVGRKLHAGNLSLVPAEQSALGGIKRKHGRPERAHPCVAGGAAVPSRAPRFQQRREPVTLGSGPGRPLGRPAAGGRVVLRRGLGAVVPPTRIPETLEQSLRVIPSVAIDEMNVAAQGLVEQPEHPLAFVGFRQRSNGCGKIV